MEHLTTVRYWAGIKAAAGTDQEQVSATTLADALAELAARHGQRFADVLARCSVLVDGAQVAGRDPALVDLRNAIEIDLLPPFAGG